MKVVVAMSGGVDSSVASALLKERGYDVIGATLQLWPRDKEYDRSNGTKGCCGIDAVTDAKKVAHKLGIPHYVMNFRDLFAQKVIADFSREYSQGRTPNPCIRCNQYIKFDPLLEKAKGLGADFIATGHHARIEPDENNGTYLLKKGFDAHKDQSYFLYPVIQEQLKHTLFPIGDLTKDKVRQIAADMNLPVASRPESQEICFIPDNVYPEFLKDHIPQAAEPGPILDAQGNTLGQHHGIMSYTIGQRKGLGIAAEEPLYVTDILPDRNAVVVGTREQTYSSELIASDLNWIAIARPEHTINVKAKIRYRHPEAKATITPLEDDNIYVKFDEPQMAITPGQSIVFYEGDVVIGGGIINKKGS
ncbi:tRNA 2-thiouridine(34) synthase MnmA [Chloroflexota bacterium]